ncbi:hypothetical protein AGMMS50229_17150 [Campylobacterota bacterium]|nr:hypothetical protein AGMMS50229_17150 [Campylobacterota bacterium]
MDTTAFLKPILNDIDQIIKNAINAKDKKMQAGLTKTAHAIKTPIADIYIYK